MPTTTFCRVYDVIKLYLPPHIMQEKGSYQQLKEQDNPEQTTKSSSLLSYGAKNVQYQDYEGLILRKSIIKSRQKIMTLVLTKTCKRRY